LRSTLANASTFGAAGARVFATGKFDITAVATFAKPLPYTGDDCPQYGDSRGAQCSGSNLTPAQPVSAPVVGGEAEAATLRYLEDQLLGGSPERSDTPNPATTLMLGPMVRGNEVTVP
ncbi:MAG: Mce family protein, partial [Rhodococcus erythropolis]|nr:Mce family protein [Rhodococcus erythropolis]